jgi:hypothetical protein
MPIKASFYLEQADLGPIVKNVVAATIRGGVTAKAAPDACVT